VLELDQLLLDFLPQGFPCPQRPSRYPRTFHMTPYQFVRIQIRRVAGQKMQGQTALGGGDVLLHAGRLVGRQAIEHQMNGLLAVPHHLLQQLDEPLGVESTLVETEPECPLSIHRRGRTARLALPGPVHYRRLAPYAPGLAVHGIGPEPRLVPEEHLPTLLFRLPGYGGEGLPLPALDRLRIALIGSLQRLLRGQPQLRQQCAYRRDPEGHAELPRNEIGHDGARPQAEVQTVLARIAAIHPAEHLAFLRRGQGPRPSRSLRRTQGADPDPRLPTRCYPFIDGRPVESVRRDHGRRRLPFAYPVDRHQADRFQGRVIQCPAVSFHVRSDHHASDKFPYCRLIYRLLSNYKTRFLPLVEMTRVRTRAKIIFSSFEILLERFPVKTRIHKGIKATLYNSLLVPVLNLIPKSLLRPFGAHLIAKAIK